MLDVDNPSLLETFLSLGFQDIFSLGFPLNLSRFSLLLVLCSELELTPFYQQKPEAQNGLSNLTSVTRLGRESGFENKATF